MRSQLGLPKHQHFQWKSLPPWGLRCAHHLPDELLLQNQGRGGNSQEERLGFLSDDVTRVTSSGQAAWHPAKLRGPLFLTSEDSESRLGWADAGMGLRHPQCGEKRAEVRNWLGSSL